MIKDCVCLGRNPDCVTCEGKGYYDDHENVLAVPFSHRTSEPLIDGSFRKKLKRQGRKNTYGVLEPEQERIIQVGSDGYIRFKAFGKKGKTLNDHPLKQEFVTFWVFSLNSYDLKLPSFKRCFKIYCSLGLKSRKRYLKQLLVANPF